MNRLKLIFGGLYIALVLLLMLLMLRHCERPMPEPEVIEEVSPEEEEVVSETDDEQLARNTGNMGQLKVTLLWDIPGDIDLHVYEPGGAHISFNNRHPRGAKGELDHDDTRGGVNSAENIYWENPDAGTYKISVNYYKLKDPRSIPCRVLIFRQGQLIKEHQLTLTREGQTVEIPPFTVD